jgi:hypothetical protein
MGMGMLLLLGAVAAIIVIIKPWTVSQLHGTCLFLLLIHIQLLYILIGLSSLYRLELLASWPYCSLYLLLVSSTTGHPTTSI